MINSNSKIKLAFVIPRYTASIGGGAETLMRALALELKFRGIEIDILTTCALDHRTWDNHFEAGKSIEDNLNIYRFKVDTRDLSSFIEQEQKIARGLVLTFADQLVWLKNSVNSRDLYHFIIGSENDYDLFFFAPYLFGTSFWGSMLLPKKSVLVPCLHDEGYAYQPLMRSMFRNVRGIMWNTKPESYLASEIYNLDDLEQKSVVVGMGFSKKVAKEQMEVRESRYLPKTYMLYSGRKETGKGLDVLIDYYYKMRVVDPTFPELVLIGAGKIEFLDKLPEGVVDLGFVSEDEKLDLMKNAVCLFQPSLNESFSIVMMEAWGEGTPVIVNSDCAVTRFHVEQSGGGFHYRDFTSFSDNVLRLIKTPEMAQRLGASGQKYVEECYSWDAVVSRFMDGLNNWIKDE